MSFCIDSGDLSPTRVVIVDDHQAIIEMMTQVVESLAGHKVVGAARDVAAALGICQRERPDILILDLAMPKAPGLSLLSELKKLSMGVKVLVFSGNLQPSAVREGLGAGVFGFVEKMAMLQEFRAAILAVGAGQAYFDAKTSQMVRGLVNRKPGDRLAQTELTGREKAVLGLIAQGQSSKEIAQTLGISIHTVINHRSSLMKKTGLRKVAQLSLYAAQAGLVKSSEKAAVL